jgi:serine/threonine protein kinase
MSHPTSKCSRDHLRLLLADQLPEALQAEVTEHVAGCESCRAALESLAGDAGWWSEIETCFRTHAQQIGQSSASSLKNVVAREGSPSHETSDCEDDSFAADFVVDFLEPCDRPEALGRLGDYEIREVIGRGGMGIVLKGFQPELGRFVAVKVMAPHLAASGAARQRFVREARAAAAIVHPHVMPIHSVCTSSRLPYLVMPFVACESLQQRIDRQGPLDTPETLRISMQVAAALAASHAQGVIHRDVKPANILLEKGVDRVLLTDFGLARAADDASLTRTGIVTGTPQYMSPEQSRGEAIDARSDLFSLGSVMYAMCAGRPPFRAETTLAVLRRICDTQPRALREINPSVPEWLERLVARLHDKSPEERVATASDVAELLGQCLAHIQQPLVAPLPETLRPTPPKPIARPIRAGLWIVATIVASLLGALAWQFVGWPFGTRSTSATQDPPISSTDPSPQNPSLESLSDEAVTQEFSALAHELDQLEERAKQPWNASSNVPLATPESESENTE